MADLRPETGSAPRGDAVWQDDNERGLRLAFDGEWEEAREAFATAADALARSLPGNAPAHEPLALVLGNLAQACFRAGHRDDAVQHQKRACALRVAIAGEDGMPVARARMDLAVMLAAAGRLEEANALVQRAIAALDHRVGEEDARLAIVLENAARIAIASGAPANAEPLLLRLHALLDAHEQSTARADALLARVAAVRASQASAAIAPSATAPQVEDAAAAAADETALEAAAAAPHHDAVELPEPLSEAFDAERPVYAHASIETSEWEDQPLRDAVAVTDVLLRNTPAGVPAITSRPGLLDTPAEPTAIVPTPSPEVEHGGDEDDLALELTDIGTATGLGVAPDVRPDVAPEDIATDIADDIMATLTPATPVRVEREAEPPRDALDLELALDDAFTAPVAPAPVAPAPTSGLLLDFAVQHGTLDEIDEMPTLEAPPITVPVPHALTPVMPAPAQPSAPPLAVVNAGPADNVAPLSDMVGTTPPTSRGTAEQRAVAPERPAPPPPAPRAARSDSAPTPRSKLIPIAIGVITAIGGAAAYLFTR